MSGTAVVLVHGRSQQMAPAARTGPDVEAALVLALKRSWLAGLGQGPGAGGSAADRSGRRLVPLLRQPVADAIAAREKAHLPVPNLDAIAVAAAVAAARAGRLADPDVAGPIGRSAAGRPPW
jgi:hypothetical protein